MINNFGIDLSVFLVVGILVLISFFTIRYEKRATEMRILHLILAIICFTISAFYIIQLKVSGLEPLHLFVAFFAFIGGFANASVKN